MNYAMRRAGTQLLGLAMIITVVACGADDAGSSDETLAQQAGGATPPPGAGPGNPAELAADGEEDFGENPWGENPWGEGIDPTEFLPPLRGLDEGMMEGILTGPCEALLVFQADVQATVAEADGYFMLGADYNWDVAVARIRRLHAMIPDYPINEAIATVLDQTQRRIELQETSDFSPTGTPADDQAIRALLAAGGYDQGAHDDA